MSDVGHTINGLGDFSMRACATCGATASLDARFCGHCGSALNEISCSACGASNSPDHAFCDHCGTRMGATPGASPPVPSVVASPISKVRSASEPTPVTTTPDPVPAISSAERKLATVLFADVVGYTSMAEHADPEVVATTVDAALRRMADVVRRFGGTIDKYLGDGLMAVFGVPQAHDDDAERAIAAALELVSLSDFAGDLSLSIGVNTGEVMAMAVGEDGQVTVIGDAVNVAARLEKVAGPGQVLAGRLTAQLAGERALLRQRSAVMVKGKSDAVEVWEAISMNPEPAAKKPGELAAFVGRTDELAFLRSHWTRAAQTRTPSAIVVTGPGGIGKTRLIQEFINSLPPDVSCVQGAYPPYGVIAGGVVIGDLIDQLGYTGDLEVDMRVRSLVGDIDPTMRTLDPKSLEREGLWGLRQFLRIKAQQHPLLLVTDDMHRSGRQLVDLITETVGRLEGVPILAIFAGRAEPSAWLAGIHPNTVLKLGPLSGEDTRRMLAGLPGGVDLDFDVAELVLERSAGNPLYLRELVGVAQANSQDVLVQAGQTSSGALPPTLKTVLAARLDAMNPLEKLCIQHLAVIGTGATSERIELLGPFNLDSQLESLVRQSLVVRGADNTFTVADPLLAEVSYETLPRNVRGLRHRGTATSATNVFERARHLALAAEYLPEDSGVSHEAAVAHAQAGVELLQGYRLADGVRLLIRAVDLGHRVPEDLLSLGRALLELGRLGEAGEVLQLARIDGEFPILRAERDTMLALARVDSDPTRAIDELSAVAHRWEELGEPVKQGEALTRRAEQLAYANRMDEAVDTIELALRVLERVNATRSILIAKRVRTLLTPDDPATLDRLMAGVAASEELGDRSQLSDSLCVLMLDEFLSSFEGAPSDIMLTEDTAHRLVHLAREIGAAELEVIALSCLAALFRMQGRIIDAGVLVSEAQRVSIDERRPAAQLREAVAFSVNVTAHPNAFASKVALRNDSLSIVTNYVLVLSLLMANRAEDALEALQNQSAVAVAVGRSWLIQRLLMARVLEQLGNVAEAEGVAIESVNLATRQRSMTLRRVADAVFAEIASAAGSTQAPRLVNALQPVDGNVCGVSVAVARAHAVGAQDLSDQTSAYRVLEDLSIALSAPGVLVMPAAVGDLNETRNF